MARLANHRFVFELVRARRGARASATAITTKTPKKKPSLIAASFFMTFLLCCKALHAC
jgi:hypothetical protein